MNTEKSIKLVKLLFSTLCQIVPISSYISFSNDQISGLLTLFRNATRIWHTQNQVFDIVPHFSYSMAFLLRWTLVDTHDKNVDKMSAKMSAKCRQNVAITALPASSPPSLRSPSKYFLFKPDRNLGNVKSDKTFWQGVCS